MAGPFFGDNCGFVTSILVLCVLGQVGPVVFWGPDPVLRCLWEMLLPPGMVHEDSPVQLRLFSHRLFECKTRQICKVVRYSDTA